MYKLTAVANKYACATLQKEAAWEDRYGFGGEG